MVSGLKELTFLVFGRNCGTDFQRTIDTVQAVSKLYPEIKFQLVVVDDGSTDSAQIVINREIFFAVDEIALPHSLGISGAINAGLSHVKYERMIWLPASNMYGVEGICNLIDYSSGADLVIGFRSNLTKARPTIKLMASLVVRGFMHIFTFHFISDFKGCNLYYTKDVKRWLNPERKHGGDLVLMTQILLQTERIVQVPTPINQSHNSRPSKKLSDNWPSWKAIISAVRGIFASVRLYHSNSNKK
jgi:glycosyltransferase involved in cell wall biosynthesis